MKILITTESPDSYLLHLGEVDVSCRAEDLKDLMLELMRVIPPSEPPDTESRCQKFNQLVLQMDDVRLQALLHRADHDDVVILSKLAERDELLMERLNKNMTEKSRRLFEEDVAYKYHQDIPESELNAALSRMRQILALLEAEALSGT